MLAKKSFIGLFIICSCILSSVAPAASLAVTSFVSPTAAATTGLLSSQSSAPSFSLNTFDVRSISSSRSNRCFGVVLAASSKQASLHSNNNNNNDDDDDENDQKHHSISKRSNKMSKRKRMRQFLGAFLLSSSLLTKSNKPAWAAAAAAAAAPAQSLRPGVTLSEIDSKSTMTTTTTAEDEVMDMDAMLGALEGNDSEESDEQTQKTTPQQTKKQQRLAKKQQQQKKKAAANDWDYDEDDDDFFDETTSSYNPTTEDEDEDEDMMNTLSEIASSKTPKSTENPAIAALRRKQVKTSPPSNLTPKSTLSKESKDSVNKVLTLAIPVPIATGLFIREAFKWNKEQKTVTKSIELVREAEKKYFNVTDLKDVGKNKTELALNETNVNGTDTAEGEDTDDDGDDDDDFDDDDDLPPPSPRRPTRGGGGGGGGGSGPKAGGGGGGGDEPPSSSPPKKKPPPRPQTSQEDLDRLNRMFKNS